MTLFTLVIGVPVLLTIWLLIMHRWQLGMWMLLLYLPFAGGIALMLRPNPAGPLLKDLLFVIPMIVVFFMMHTRDLNRVRIPPVLTVLIVAFGALVLVQVFNPALSKMTIGIVGIKVWLLYIPLAYMVNTMLRTPDDLVRLMRIGIVPAVIPCVLGILQFGICATIGYEEGMKFFYGSNAKAATQNFTSFEMGTEFFRIPSTFSYVTQYSGYCLMMIVVIYILMSIETDMRWRLYCRVLLAVVIIAGILSGARSNFLFVPLLLVTILFLDAKLSRMASGLIFGPVIIIGTMQVAGLDPLHVVSETAYLVGSYGNELVLPDLIRGMSENPFGKGTGMNTGPAVNLLSGFEAARAKLIEGYYAKTVIELGFLGLLLLVLLIFGLILYGLQVRRSLRDPMARSCAAAIIAFIIVMALHSFKGWQVDLDPINVWYWLFVGILFRLPHLNFREIAEQRRVAELERASRGRGRPARGFAAGRRPRPARF